MAARQELLNQALAIGREELGCLVKGDVFEADKLCKDRDRYLSEALAELDQDHLEQLSDSLVEMKSLQNEISLVARRLHASLKKDLTGMRKQNKRIAGYSFGAGNMPRLAKERFLNKKG